MDIISQLQEQVNSIAATTFNVFGTLQRDAPPVQLSLNYPDPPPSAPTTDEPKQLSADLVKAAKQFDALVAALPLSDGGEEAQLKRIAQLRWRTMLLAKNSISNKRLQRRSLSKSRSYLDKQLTIAST
ncbi:hypothetical protein Bca52824_053702 [Brassica carinata]|uniref:Mediator of RNA polymerase II transcription subunit 21 n=1 Tax=Brassica carinata TaxID=52824 RepID=A0A8X7UKW2_BRACI|nr:hypothetical protein Bca52824_053702 [Brassica carinata]